jgi:hypothetical protein
MTLTAIQKRNLCKRYWENNETYLIAKKRIKKERALIGYTNQILRG